jgi:hypothetical protein
MSAISSVMSVTQVQGGSTLTAQSRLAEGFDARSGGLGPIVINPSLRFDLKTRVVVMEFFDEVGKLVNSIPSQQKLKAYQTNVGSAPEAAGKVSLSQSAGNGLTSDREIWARGNGVSREIPQLVLLA